MQQRLQALHRCRQQRRYPANRSGDRLIISQPAHESRPGPARKEASDGRCIRPARIPPHRIIVVLRGDFPPAKAVAVCEVLWKTPGHR
jgi:hypothetical protein